MIDIFVKWHGRVKGSNPFQTVADRLFEHGLVANAGLFRDPFGTLKIRNSCSRSVIRDARLSFGDLTQGEPLQEPQENLRDLHQDLTSG